MKIAYFVLDISFLGGIERYTRELAAYVANMGHEVHIYSSTECNIPSVTSHKIKVYSFLPRWLKILQFQITLNNKDVSKLYTASDLLVLPTKHEAFGMCGCK